MISALNPARHLRDRSPVPAVIDVTHVALNGFAVTDKGSQTRSKWTGQCYPPAASGVVRETHLSLSDRLPSRPVDKSGL